MRSMQEQISPSEMCGSTGQGASPHRHAAIRKALIMAVDFVKTWGVDALDPATISAIAHIVEQEHPFAAYLDYRYAVSEKRNQGACEQEVES